MGFIHAFILDLLCEHHNSWIHPEVLGDDKEYKMSYHDFLKIILSAGLIAMLHRLEHMCPTIYNKWAFRGDS